MSDKVRKLILTALQEVSDFDIKLEAEKFLEDHPNLSIEALSEAYMKANISLQQICKVVGDDYLRIMGNDKWCEVIDE